VIPPDQNGEFVARMEDVLEVYTRPYDPRFPVVCMDERPTQLVRETRRPLPARRGAPRRYDYEYERAGTACVFLFTEPLGQWRRARARARRTAVDWAQEVRAVVDEDFSDAERVILVCDNLNTHTIGSLYEAFPPDVARGLVERLEIHYTPKHGSWLNIAECELSVLSRQSLSVRTPDLPTLKRKVTAWERRRNKQQTGVDWQFTTRDARRKLRRLYPEIQML